jgi:hypothetical protein
MKKQYIYYSELENIFHVVTVNSKNALVFKFDAFADQFDHLIYIGPL